MSFFEDTRGTIYPTRRITRMVKGKHDGGKFIAARVYLDEEDYGIEVWDSEIDRIREATAPVWPATEGFWLVAHWTDGPDDAEQWTERTPVIGWRYSADGAIRPVTIDWNYNEEPKDNYAVLRPDGAVRSDALDADFRTLENWQEEVVARAKAKRVEREAAAEGAKA